MPKAYPYKLMLTGLPAGVFIQPVTVNEHACGLFLQQMAIM